VSVVILCSRKLLNGLVLPTFAMKEDILEQIVEDYLQSQGYFTRHNVKFRPSSTDPDFVTREDSSYSDIDIVGLHPDPAKPVLVVSCKSWQAGHDPIGYWKDVAAGADHKGRVAWKAYRELTKPKCSDFKYITAVTRLIGGDAAKQVWENHAQARQQLENNPIEIVTIEQMVATMLPAMTSTTEGSMLGRTLQLLKAADCLRSNL
jgi:hypothetical protein